KTLPRKRSQPACRANRSFDGTDFRLIPSRPLTGPFQEGECGSCILQKVIPGFLRNPELTVLNFFCLS
ncbi:MAG: hypothetical protein LBJ59_12125, partial [Zoogloeaceae bacterium]|nr:hypothetical protein [Zoogloeaceae bacterium]